MQIVWIGIVVDISRGVVFVIVGENGLLLVLSGVRLGIAAVEGPWTAI
jgi:hypothetical protein